MAPLTDKDIDMFSGFRIDRELLAEAKLDRRTDSETRELLGLNGIKGDMSGVHFPYFNPVTGQRVNDVVRRDHPDMEDGKPHRKYVSGYGNRQHPVYNNVGVVKQENNNTFPDARRGLSRAPVGRLSETLDRSRRAYTIETGTKRNEVQLSFVP